MQEQRLQIDFWLTIVLGEKTSYSFNLVYVFSSPAGAWTPLPAPALAPWHPPPSPFPTGHQSSGRWCRTGNFKRNFFWHERQRCNRSILRRLLVSRLLAIIFINIPPPFDFSAINVFLRTFAGKKYLASTAKKARYLFRSA